MSRLEAVTQYENALKQGKKYYNACLSRNEDPYPIVLDEIAYEGNIQHGWGNIPGEELIRRFWEGALRGGYPGHGDSETLSGKCQGMEKTDRNRVAHVGREETKRQIPELLNAVNLDDASYKKVGGFSGGMRQRVLLAQALLGSPEVLLLDEPTAGLDPEERVRLREYVKGLSADRIVLITTHITADVESIADEILLLDGGKLIAEEPPETFIAGCGARTLEEAYIRRLHGEKL